MTTELQQSAQAAHTSGSSRSESQSTLPPPTPSSGRNAPVAFTEPAFSTYFSSFSGDVSVPLDDFAAGDVEGRPAVQREYDTFPATDLGVTSDVQWDAEAAPPSDLDSTLAQILSTRDSYRIADAGMGLQMMPEYVLQGMHGIANTMFPTSGLHEPFGPLAGSEQVIGANEPEGQPGYWSNQTTAQYVNFQPTFV